MSKVLIIQTAFLGDVILATPMIEASRKILRATHVSFIAAPNGGVEILGHPGPLIEGLDEVIVYDKRGADRGLAGLIRMVKQIRSRSFDIILTPHRSARSSVLSWAGKAGETSGFKQAALSSLYSIRAQRYEDRHEVQKNLELIRALSQNSREIDAIRPKVSVTDEARQAVDDLLKEADVHSKRLIGIAPGSVWGTKRWLPEGFAQVADDLNEPPDTGVILIGSKADFKSANQVQQAAKSDVINLAGKTSVSQLAALIERLALFISNDSGPVHVASALDIPTLAIFGATVPAQGFSPLATRQAIVEVKDLPCRPCGAHGPTTCPLEHFKCMRQITPEMVIKAAKELL